MRKTHRIGLAALAGAALVLSACGSSSSGSSTTTPAATTSAAATTGATDTGGGATTGATDTGGGATTGASDTGATDTAATDTGGGGASGGTLVVWADNSANTAKAIEPLCKQWADENGVTCTVKKFNGGGDLTDALTKGFQSGDVPDVFEAPHDQIGTMVKNGFLAPVDLSANKDKFNPVSVTAVTLNGNTYGVPWAVENIALFVNKKMESGCPATFDDAVANAEKLITAGTVKKGLGIAMQISTGGDFYHWYPLFTADGGYVFGQNADGTPNPKDLGIDSTGAVAAGKRLQQLVAAGIFSGSVTYDIAVKAFQDGQTPYLITGPWQTPDSVKALGNDLLVCPIPTWKGDANKAQPFVGVRTFFMTSKAPDPVLASTFLSDEVQTTEFMNGMYAVDPRPSAWVESFQKESTDPIVKAFGEYGQQGIPIPNIPEMTPVWTEMGPAMYKITLAGSDPSAILKTAAAAVNKANGTG
jgi:maltose-binding protein MalE